MCCWPVGLKWNLGVFMLASLINNSLVTPSPGTRPASAAPSVGRAWSLPMSLTRMGSFIAKVSGCTDFLETSFLKGPRGGEDVPCLEGCLCLPEIRMLNLAVQALGRKQYCSKEMCSHWPQLWASTLEVCRCSRVQDHRYLEGS